MLLCHILSPFPIVLYYRLFAVNRAVIINPNTLPTKMQDMCVKISILSPLLINF